MSENVTDALSTVMGKPVPVIVIIAPPRGLTMFGVTEETVKAIVMSETPLAKGKRPLGTLTFDLWVPALGALARVHEI